jgi:hypothetical protein
MPECIADASTLDTKIPMLPTSAKKMRMKMAKLPSKVCLAGWSVMLTEPS